MTAKLTILLLVASSLVIGSPLSATEPSACATTTINVTATPATGSPLPLISVTSTSTVTTTIPGHTGPLSCFASATILTPEPANKVKRAGPQYGVYQYLIEIVDPCHDTTIHSTSYATSVLDKHATNSFLLAESRINTAQSHDPLSTIHPLTGSALTHTIPAARTNAMVLPDPLATTETYLVSDTPSAANTISNPAIPSAKSTLSGSFPSSFSRTFSGSASSFSTNAVPTAALISSISTFALPSSTDTTTNTVSPSSNSAFLNSTLLFSTDTLSRPSISGCSATRTVSVTITPPPSTKSVPTTTIITTTTVTQTAAGSGHVLAPYPQGLNYYFYQNHLNKVGASNVAGAIPQLIDSTRNSSTFDHSGSIADLNALRVYSPNNADEALLYGPQQTLEMPDGFTANGIGFAIVFQGYFFAAAGAGSYSIVCMNGEQDDLAVVWLGNEALENNWSSGNAAFLQKLTDPEQSISITMQAGQAVPMTALFAQRMTPTYSAFYIITPDGQMYGNTTGFFIGGCDNTGFSP